MTPIYDYDGYNDKMNKSMLDKLFFLSHVDADIFVDFGCADGAMIRTMSRIDPESLYIGYDNDLEMIEKAILLKENSRNVFLTNWKTIESFLEDSNYPYSKSCLILSSVIHEVFSYEDEKGIEEFYQRVFNSGFDYIAVRDMALCYDPLSYKNVANPSSWIEDIYKTADSCQVKEFEDVWGKLNLNNNAIHFLLKYKYVDNWEREVKENYFSYDLDKFIDVGYDAGYKVNYHEYFYVPFIRRQIFKDFGFWLNENTHYKLILEKK